MEKGRKTRLVRISFAFSFLFLSFLVTTAQPNSFVDEETLATTTGAVNTAAVILSNLLSAFGAQPVLIARLIGALVLFAAVPQVKKGNATALDKSTAMVGIGIALVYLFLVPISIQLIFAVILIWLAELLFLVAIVKFVLGVFGAGSNKNIWSRLRDMAPMSKVVSGFLIIVLFGVISNWFTGIFHESITNFEQVSNYSLDSAQTQNALLFIEKTTKIFGGIVAILGAILMFWGAVQGILENQGWNIGGISRSKSARTSSRAEEEADEKDEEELDKSRDNEVVLKSVEPDNGNLGLDSSRGWVGKEFILKGENLSHLDFIRVYKKGKSHIIKGQIPMTYRIKKEDFLSVSDDEIKIALPDSKHYKNLKKGNIVKFIGFRKEKGIDRSTKTRRLIVGGYRIEEISDLKIIEDYSFPLKDLKFYGGKELKSFRLNISGTNLPPNSNAFNTIKLVQAFGPFATKRYLKVKNEAYSKDGDGYFIELTPSSFGNFKKFSEIPDFQPMDYYLEIDYDGKSVNSSKTGEDLLSIMEVNHFEVESVIQRSPSPFTIEIKLSDDVEIVHWDTSAGGVRIRFKEGSNDPIIAEGTNFLYNSEGRNSIKFSLDANPSILSMLSKKLGTDFFVEVYGVGVRVEYLKLI